MNTRPRALVALAFLLMLLHTFDEAFWHHESGGPTNFVVVFATGAVVVVLYPWMAMPWRAIVVGFLGLDALVQALVGHIAPIVSGHGTFVDMTGVLFAAGGALLLAITVRDIRRRRDVVARAWRKPS